MNNNSLPQSCLIGVNLGGWLVLEKWMTPSVFSGTHATNEYELSQSLEGRSRIKKHRQDFITSQDLQWLSDHGVQAIRVPIGHWAITHSSPYVDAQARLDWLMKAAKAYNLSVVLCLHAAPGPQNTNDHSGSGRAGKVAWYRKDNRTQTTQLLEKLAQRYGTSTALWGIELLNEPSVRGPWQRFIMARWARQTTVRLKALVASHVKIIVSDCFKPGFWSGRISDTLLDIHHYQVFSTNDRARPNYQAHKRALEQATDAYTRYQSDQSLIIGEWSAVLPRGVNPRQHAAQFISDQQAAFGRVAIARFFWSYKTEAPDLWNYRHLVEQGILTDNE